MSKKKKYPQRWAKRWFEIGTYKPLGFLKRKRFYVYATTWKTARIKLEKSFPKAEVLYISSPEDR